MTTLAVNTALVTGTYLDCRTFAKGRQLCLAASPAGTTYTFFGSSDGTVAGVVLGKLNPDANGNGVLNLPDDCSPYIKFTVHGSSPVGTLWVAGQNGVAAVVATGTEVSEITIGTSSTDMTNLGPGRQIYATGGTVGDVLTIYAARTSGGVATVIGTIKIKASSVAAENGQAFLDLPGDSSLFVKYASSGSAPTAIGMRGPLYPAA